MKFNFVHQKTGISLEKVYYLIYRKHIFIYVSTSLDIITSTMNNDRYYVPIEKVHGEYAGLQRNGNISLFIWKKEKNIIRSQFVEDISTQVSIYNDIHYL